MRRREAAMARGRSASIRARSRAGARSVTAACWSAATARRSSSSRSDFPVDPTAASNCPPLPCRPMRARLWVVIPTYNEAVNVERIVRTAGAELERIVPGEHRILVVDDASPDGTGAIADALAAELPTVDVLHRPLKDGLGHAYRA